MKVSNTDREVLRALAGDLAEIAALDIHAEKAAMWARVNKLQNERPMVWMNEIPWHEMNVDDELTLKCEDPFRRELEDDMRKTIYQWRHMPGDMIVSNYISCPLVIEDTGFGLDEDVEVAITDPESDVVSRKFHRQIIEPEDIEKIANTAITHDEDATEQRYEMMCDAMGDIMPIRKEGIKGMWFSPWDELIRWWGVQEAMMDLVLRPQMVNDIVSRLVDVYIDRLDQWEELNLLTPNNDNTRVGSGAYGYTDELPGESFDPQHVTASNLWGCATAQIFSQVSPQMHWEFALRHEMRYLERWGLTYYGCCEPLDIKMDILRRIPNLRKISMSPWVNPERSAGLVGEDYVYSFKPNPAVLAEDRWRPDQARQDIVRFLEPARACRVEIIMKDVSTVRRQPQRLWEWEKIVMEVVEDYAG
ncbi:MAG: hypothetical protein QGH60_09325 [Phycisphaerae bacterium]|jgi:hypothetical protein|nr:hypothetical protein [Phycisphaerae bacterium]